MSRRGYFIDWNGQVRSTDDPGHGYCCEVDSIARHVTVISKRGITIHEAELYRSLDAIARTGVQTEWISGSYPWLQRSVGRPEPRGAQLQPTSAPMKTVGLQRAFHHLRSRCTTGARIVYARLLPGATSSEDATPAPSEPKSASSH